MIKIFNLFKKNIQPYNEACFSVRNVLVGIVRNETQYLINTANNFYHIPAKRLYMLDMPIEYVALFKSDRMFNQNEAGIYVYGKVKSIKLIKRSQINEIPKNSNENYIRFDVERWIPLENPIKVQEVSKTHMFTTMYLLQNSMTIPELYMLSYEDLQLYRFLYKMCVNSVESHFKFKKYIYKGIKIGFTKDFIEIIYPDTEHRRYERMRFSNKPFALFNLITEKN